jgi:predicted enzyme related to lactoylglutathione lyase
MASAAVCHYTFKRTRVFCRRAALKWTWRGGQLQYFATMIKQIKFVSIPVSDQNRALNFYTDKLGFTIITDQPFNGKQRWIELRIPKADTRIALFTPEGHESRVGSFTGISLECEDTEETYTELTAKGVVFDGPPKKERWGVFATFKDSEGNSFVLSSSKG